MNESASVGGFPTLDRQVAYTSKVLHDLADATLSRFGADLSTWVVLLQAHRGGGAPPSSQRQLADGLHMSGPALVRHLDRLEDAGLLRRRRDEHDRRVTRVVLTAKGKRLLGRLQAAMDEHDRRLRSCLTATEARTLERALGKLHSYAARARPH